MRVLRFPHEGVCVFLRCHEAIARRKNPRAIVSNPMLKGVRNAEANFFSTNEGSIEERSVVIIAHELRKEALLTGCES